MALCPTVRFLFPLGMAMRHRASSPLLPSYSNLFASLLFFSLLALFRRLIWYWYVLPWRYWTYCHYVVCRGFHIDVMPAIQLLINPTRFLLPWDNGTPRHWNPSRSTGTFEPRDIGTPSAQGGERAPTREPGTGTDPRNGFLFFRYPLGSHRRSLRCAFHCQAAHGGYDVLGRCTLVAGKVFGLFFPETLKGRCGPTATVELSGHRLYTRAGGRCSLQHSRKDRRWRSSSRGTPLTDGGGRVTVALKRREGSAALPSGDAEHKAEGSLKSERQSSRAVRLSRRCCHWPMWKCNDTGQCSRRCKDRCPYTWKSVL